MTHNHDVIITTSGAIQMMIMPALLREIVFKKTMTVNSTLKGTPSADSSHSEGQISDNKRMNESQCNNITLQLFKEGPEYRLLRFSIKM